MRNIRYMTTLGADMFAALDVLLFDGAVPQAGSLATTQDLPSFTLHAFELVSRLCVVAGTG